jgi:hypothetical protein
MGWIEQIGQPPRAGHQSLQGKKFNQPQHKEQRRQQRRRTGYPIGRCGLFAHYRFWHTRPGARQTMVMR